jgi:hypothetical protein
VIPQRFRTDCAANPQHFCSIFATITQRLAIAQLLCSDSAAFKQRSRIDYEAITKLLCSDKGAITESFRSDSEAIPQRFAAIIQRFHSGFSTIP